LKGGVIESNFYSNGSANDYLESKKFKKNSWRCYKAYFVALVHRLMFTHGEWLSNFNGSVINSWMDVWVRANS
jgi:hypothetical protein